MEKTQTFNAWIKEIKKVGTPAVQQAKAVADQKKRQRQLQIEEEEKKQDDMNLMIAASICGVAACL